MSIVSSSQVLLSSSIMFSNFPISSPSTWDPERIKHIKVPKRTRSSQPKVRTGCVTCKRRHVKCDEVKPACNRCERAGIKCDGYEAPPPPQERAPKPRKSPVQTSRALLPRLEPAPQILPSAPPTRRRTTSSEWLHPRTPSVEPPQPSALGSSQHQALSWNVQPQAGAAIRSLWTSSTPGPLDADDELYLNFFRDQLRCNLTASCQAKFWPNVILREGERNECLRHAILATGAIAMALHSNSSPSSPSSSRASTPSTSSTRLNVHHQNALHHHLRATSLFRKRIETDLDSISPEVLLSVTLLLMAYELLQDNQEAAQNLVGSGVVLLKHALQLRPGNPQTGLSEHGIMNMQDLAVVEARLPTMSVWVVDPLDTDNFADTSVDTDLGLETEPPVYGTTPLEEVVSSWNRFCLRSAAFVTKHTEGQLRDAIIDTTSAYGEQAELLSQLFVWRTQLHKYDVEAQSLAEQYTPDSAVAAERQARLDSIQLMQLQDLVDIIFVSCCLDRTGMAFDTYLREYRDIVSGCAEMLERQRRARQSSVGSSYSSTSSNADTFSLDAGLSPILGFVVSTCRKHDIRMQALDYFKQLRWTQGEGGWDLRALCVGKMGLISLEQGGALADGRIPATARYEWSGGRPDMERQKLEAEYRALIPDATGRPVIVKLSLDM
jgi:hypothetical protein